MSWNEIKIGLAPSGSKVFQSRDRFTTTDDGYPVTIVTTLPPRELQSQQTNVDNLERWLTARNFKEFRKKPQSSRFDLDDTSVLIYNDHGNLKQLTLNLQVGLDARTRLKEWEKFVNQLCEYFHLELIDSNIGLVKPSELQRLVKSSFAWECFLKREKCL